MQVLCVYKPQSVPRLALRPDGNEAKVFSTLDMD